MRHSAAAPSLLDNLLHEGSDFDLGCALVALVDALGEGEVSIRLVLAELAVGDAVLVIASGAGAVDG